LILAAFIVGATITTVVISYKHNYKVAYISPENFNVEEDVFTEIYTKPYTRVQPFLIGMFTAIIFLSWEKKWTEDGVINLIVKGVESWVGYVIFVFGVLSVTFWIFA
jgi:hypothetical protein